VRGPGVRQIPLAGSGRSLLGAWKKARAKEVAPDALVFSTRSGKPISPNNVLRRWVFPACDDLKFRRATSLTFR